jgi:hypothetical protein
VVTQAILVLEFRVTQASVGSPGTVGIVAYPGIQASVA